MLIVDTNVILRFLVGDEKNQQAQASNWFAQAEQGELKLVIKPLVIAEVCFVLESFYKKNRAEISDALVVLLSQKWLSVEDRDILLALWPWYKKNLHFVDSYLLAWSSINSGKILSFDRQILKKIEKKD